jgi:hypothetical protein
VRAKKGLLLPSGRNTHVSRILRQRESNVKEIIRPSFNTLITDPVLSRQIPASGGSGDSPDRPRTKSRQENFFRKTGSHKKNLHPANKVACYAYFSGLPGPATTFLKKLSKYQKKVLTFVCKFGLIPLSAWGLRRLITMGNLSIAF